MDMLMLSVKRTLLDMTNITPSFPINVNLEKNKETDCWEVEIRNFIGEKLVRRVVMRPGVEVEASKNQKDQLELSGNVRTAVQQPIQPMLTSSSRSRTSPKVPPTFSKSARSATRISESSWTVSSECCVLFRSGPQVGEADEWEGRQALRNVEEWRSGRKATE